MVILFALPRDVAARIADAYRSEGHVQLCDSREGLLDVLDRLGTGAVLVLPARDRAGSSNVPFVRLLVSRYPNLPFLVHCAPRFEESSEIRALALAGAHEFLFHGSEHSTTATRAAIESARREAAADAIMATVRALVPERLSAFVEYCLVHPSEATSVESVSAALGLNRRTLSNRCREAGFPPPAEMIYWCRLAIAAFWLTSSGRTVERISADLGFSSDTALRNMLKRYLGKRATEIREAGMTAFTAALSRRLGETRAPRREALSERAS